MPIGKDAYSFLFQGKKYIINRIHQPELFLALTIAVVEKYGFQKELEIPELMNDI